MSAKQIRYNFDSNICNISDIDIKEARAAIKHSYDSSPTILQVFGRESATDDRFVKTEPVMMFSEGFTSCVGLACIDPYSRHVFLSHLQPYVDIKSQSTGTRDIITSIYNALSDAIRNMPGYMADEDRPMPIFIFHGYTPNDHGRLTHWIEKDIIPNVLPERFYKCTYV